MLRRRSDDYWCHVAGRIETRESPAVALTPFPNQHRLFRHVWDYFVMTEPEPRLLVHQR